MLFSKRARYVTKRSLGSLRPEASRTLEASSASVGVLRAGITDLFLGKSVAVEPARDKSKVTVTRVMSDATFAVALSSVMPADVRVAVAVGVTRATWSDAVVDPAGVTVAAVSSLGVGSFSFPNEMS